MYVRKYNRFREVIKLCCDAAIELCYFEDAVIDSQMLYTVLVIRKVKVYIVTYIISYFRYLTILAIFQFSSTIY
ncbi:hypothetical protein GFV14_00551 [Candidatus Hartigia pinicola]|nr:hypothetical protein GFV14_00551 [Candidatus Hartigia pinicola]